MKKKEMTEKREIKKRMHVRKLEIENVSLPFERVYES